MEETIELKELLEILWKRKWMIVLATVSCLLLSFFYTSYYTTPIYKSDTTLMVNHSKGMSASDIAASFDLSSVNLSQRIVITYGEIVKSRIVLEQVIDRLELDYSYNQLLRNIESRPVNNTEILRITVNDPNPKQAALIANTISDVFVKEVMRILKVNNVETIDKAIPSPSPHNIRPVLNMAIALVLGGMIGVFMAFGLEYLDQTIKTDKDVEKHLRLSVIGSIPDHKQVSKI